jgi:hypothetical protein
VPFLPFFSASMEGVTRVKEDTLARFFDAAREAQSRGEKPGASFTLLEEDLGVSMRGGGARAWAAGESCGCLPGMAGTPRVERGVGREGGGIREEDWEARWAELGAGKDGGGMRDEGAVGALNEGDVCGLGVIFGGGGIEFEVGARREGALLDSGGFKEKEGAVAVFDESSEKEGTAIEGAAGVA